MASVGSGLPSHKSTIVKQLMSNGINDSWLGNNSESDRQVTHWYMVACFKYIQVEKFYNNHSSQIDETYSRVCAIKDQTAAEAHRRGFWKHVSASLVSKLIWAACGAFITLIVGSVWLSLNPKEGQGPTKVTKETGEVTAPPADRTEPLATTALPPAPVATAMEPEKPAAAAPGTYIIERGDTLAKIATKLYGDPKKHTAIARANPGLNQNQLKVGQAIKLPDLPIGLKQNRKRAFNEGT
jgi:LysM repeat protein